MVVMKFGGTSMGSAERMPNSAAIVQGRAARGRVGVIVSAVGGVSNRLQAAIGQAVAGLGPNGGAAASVDGGGHNRDARAHLVRAFPKPPLL